MADTQTWSLPPGSELRRLKTDMETEMMIKLGAKKETIEVHPLILAQRAHRPRSQLAPDYSRVKPPYLEEVPANRNPWDITDKAARQMSKVIRQGPRKLHLPRVPTHKAIKTVYVPAEDEEYRKRRVWRLWKRDEILAEWAAFQRQAFVVRYKSLLTLPDLEPLRRYSSSSLFSARSPPVVKPAKGGDRSNKAKKHSSIPFTHVPPSGKPRGRWQGMARQLLWYAKAAQMRVPEGLPRSEVRIYVSCTEDLSEEREFLAEVAYPELRKFCEKQGLTCHVVDLRHGNNRLSNSRETCDVIHNEIARCQKTSLGPCFVSLVGKEADDEELPGWFEADDMLAIRGLLVKAEDEPAVEAVDNFYRLDSNYHPSIYLLQESARAGEALETAILRKTIPEAMQQLRDRGELEDSPGYYSYSSTVKEIESGLLTCSEPRRQTICLMAKAAESESQRKTSSAEVDAGIASKFPDGHSVPKEYTESVGNPSADKLRAAIVDVYSRLGSNNNLVLFNLSSKKSMAYMREICTLFLSAVTGLVERQMKHAEFDVSHHLTPAADAVQHVAAGRAACSGHLGGESVPGSLSDVLRDPTGLRPVVVTGAEGAGKTALTSLIAVAVAKLDPQRKVVFRVAGLTLQASSLFHLLKAVHRQVTFLYDADCALSPELSLAGVLDSFRLMLHGLGDRLMTKGQLTIVLDGLDRLPDMTPGHLATLMTGLPHGVSLVVSVTSTGPLYDTVKNFAPPVHLFSCPLFTPERTKAYLHRFLAARQHVLSEDQTRAVMRELAGDTRPLVALTASVQTARWPSHTLNEVLDISGDLESAFHRLVEASELHIGYRFTRCALSLLAVSRFGLAELELLDILATDSELLDQLKEEAEGDLSVLEGYPYQLHLSRLIARLQPFLCEVRTEGETVLMIGHETLKKVVVERFMGDDFIYHVHSRLASYFQFTRRGHLLSSRDIVEGRYKNLSHYLWRTLRYVPYHLCHAFRDREEAWKKLKSEVFMKFSWIINEIYAGFFNDFLDDLSYCMATLGLDDEVLFVRQFLSGVREAVIFNPVSLASLMASQDLPGLQQIQHSVSEAQEWLKQVHLQVLVPTSYSAPKTSQLQLNPALARSVTAVVSDAAGDVVVLQYSDRLTTLNPSTQEESPPLTSPRGPVISAHVWDEARMLTVVTAGSGPLSEAGNVGPPGSAPAADKMVLETFSLDKRQLVMTSRVPDSPVTWLQVRPDGVALYASGSVVKRIALDKGTISEMYSTAEEIVDVATTDSRQSKLVTLHVLPSPQLRLFDSRKKGWKRVIALKDAVLSAHCKPLTMTKDLVHVAVACQRQILLVDLHVERVTHVLEFNNVPLALLALSRSHEHVFAATAAGVVRCFKFNAGAMVMDASIHNPDRDSAGRSQLAVPTSPRRGQGPTSPSGRRSKTPGTDPFGSAPPGPRTTESTAGDTSPEQVTALVTSEDDHFLFAASTRGRVVMLHVPTGAEVCVLSVAEDIPVREMTYFSSAAWFQCLVTVDRLGLARLWNLRPVVSQARRIITDIITDTDLLREENSKLDLGSYFHQCQQRRHDRIFLNGPDVSAFYRTPPAPGLFAPVSRLDPALQPPQSWVASGCLGDCGDVRAVATGSNLSEILVTATEGGELARWSLQDGSLTMVRPCPWALKDGEAVEWLKPVYFDQALCVVARQTNGLKTVAVQYPEDKKLQPLLIHDVNASHVSHNGSLMVNVITAQHAELTLLYWDLINGQEYKRVVLAEAETGTRQATTLTFSSDLSACAFVLTHDARQRPRQREKAEKGTEGEEGGERGKAVIQIWNIRLQEGEGEKGKKDGPDKEKKEVSQGRQETAAERIRQPIKDGGANKKARSDAKEASGTSAEEGAHETPDNEDWRSRRVELPVKPTALGFDLDTRSLLVGTEHGLVLLVSVETLTVTSVLTAEGVEPVAALQSGLSQFSPPHAGGVRRLFGAGSTEGHVIVSMCERALCVWNLTQKRLLVTVQLQGQTETFTYQWLSRDCRVLVFVTSRGVLAVWDVDGRRQLCAFRLQATVTSLAVTPDCRRVAVLLDDGVSSRVRVYDVRNIDDIRVDDEGSKQKRQMQQQQQQQPQQQQKNESSEGIEGSADSD